MELSPEDSLRLNVLVNQPLHAVRIDESALTVYGLTERGEARVPLRVTGREDRYLRTVREFLSSHFLGSPGGYPVYLKRWTRMGQARDEGLAQLLLLGEPEAVVAVVHAQGLTHELARRSWWAMPTADNARRMLDRRCVVEGELGTELVNFLLEFLPFEAEPQAVIDSVRLILASGRASETARAVLWAKARRKESYYVGFLRALPDALPEPSPPHPAWHEAVAALTSLAEAGNRHAQTLLRVLGGPGQTFLRTVQAVLEKPANQDVVVELMLAVGDYFAPVRPAAAPEADVVAMTALATYMIEKEQAPAALRALVDAVPQLRQEIIALLVLSCLGERVVAPIFAVSDAVGTVMRRQLEPVIAPLLLQLAVLRGLGA